MKTMPREDKRRFAVRVVGCGLLLLAVAAALGGCAWLFPPPEPPAVVIPDTTQVVDEATEERLVEVRGAGEVLVFDRPTAFLDRLQPGEVMVFGVTDKTPYGLLRKVEQVRTADDRVVVETVQATLEDAIASGVIEFSMVLTPEHVATTTALKPGVSLVAPQEGVRPQLIGARPFRVGLENVKLRAGVTLSGHIEFTPQIDFRAEIGRDPWRLHHLDELRFVLTVPVDAEIEVAATVSGAVEATEDILVTKFKPITIPAGKLPIIITPVLYLNVGVDGQVSVGVTAGIASARLMIEGGVRYDRGRGWDLIRRYEREFTPNVRLGSVTRRAAVKAFAGPKLDLKFWGIGAAYGTAHAFLDFAKDPATRPVWRLYGGLQAGAGVKVEIVGVTLVRDRSWPDLLSHRWRIADSESLPTQPPTATITSPPAGSTFAQGASIAFRGSATDPEDGALTGASLVWTSNIAGRIGTGTSFTRTLPIGAHTITLTATDSARATGTASVTITVTASPAPSFDFAMSATPSSGTVTRGASIPTTVRAWRTAGPTTRVSFSIVGLPTGVTASPSSWSWDLGDQNRSVTFTVGANAPVGTRTVTIQGTGGGVTRTATFALTVTAAGGRAAGQIAFSSNRDGNMEVYVMNADGSNQRNLTRHPASDGSPVWSPDGTKIAFESYRDGNWEIYVMNADGSNQRRLTNHPAGDWNPAWSSDGTKIAFASGRDWDHEIYVMNADGSNQRNLTNTPTRRIYRPDDGDPAWSPDGTKIAFSSTRDRDWGIYVMNADGSNQRRLTGHHRSYDYDPAWSPDGTRIAFASVRDGSAEIYVMNADGSNERNLTRYPDHDSNPAWSPDGTEIAFASARDRNYEIYVMNADGTSQRNLTNHPGHDVNPAWSPIAP